MGSSPTRQLISPEQDSFSSRYTYIRNKGDISYYIQNITSKEYATKIFICDTPEEQMEFFALAEKTAALRHENIIGIEKVYCLENKSCGTVASKYMALFPYPFRNIKDEREERLMLQENFSEPELWSILLSVCRTLDFLHTKSLPFTAITSQHILIDKEGLIQLDAHHLVLHTLFQDNYVSRNKNLRFSAPECRKHRVSYVNLREIEKYNVYALGMILLELLEMRDLMEFEEERGDRGEREMLALLINRATYVSGELRQMLRRLTEERKENRPGYRQIINFIENEEGASGVLYNNQQNQSQIPTAKKNTSSYIDPNSLNLNFEQFNINNNNNNPKSSSNLRINIPRSSTIANGYSIPSFSYNNIRQGIQESKVRESMKQTQSPPPQSNTAEYVIREDEKLFYQSDMTENHTGLPPPPFSFNQAVPHPVNIPSVPITQSLVNPQKSKMLSTANFSPPKQPPSFPPPQTNPLNFPKQMLPPLRINNLSVKPESTESPSQIHHIESKVSQIQPSPHVKLLKTNNVADEIKMISPKPSFFTRESNPIPTKRESKHNFSKTGSIQGFNKIYNDNPSNYYDKYDYRDLNNLGELWLYYEGNFKDGKRVGPGTIFMTNGEKFQGNFINDFAEGRGKYSTMDWKEVEGIWKKGILIAIV